MQTLPKILNMFPSSSPRNCCMCIFDFLSLLCSSTLISPLFSAGWTNLISLQRINTVSSYTIILSASCSLHISASTITIGQEEGEEGQSKGRREYNKKEKWEQVKDGRTKKEKKRGGRRKTD